ncbi:MAG: hypothetical protein ACTHKL_16115 [Streptosporangiaceae bacterium]
MARVESVTGPWDEMHSSQRNETTADTVKVPLESVNYRLAMDPLQSCGTCAMNSGGICDRITGRVQDDHTCDVWVASFPDQP